MAIAIKSANNRVDRVIISLVSLIHRNNCRFFGLLIFISIAISGCQSNLSEPITAPPLRPAQQKLLDRWELFYDADRQMLQRPFRSPGYHSQTPGGTLVHPTRESLIFAIALLQRAQAEPSRQSSDRQRAIDIIGSVVELQDRDPESATRGVWPWHAEEPLAEMASPDLNWADFCGASICQILIEHDDELPANLQNELRESLRWAADAIRRRNVGPDYTNVAVMGGGVCAITGEILSDDDLLAYGRTRLQGVVERAGSRGDFSEYNSPPYVNVVIAECERIIQLIEDESSSQAAEAIRQIAWKTIAASYHPATSQIAGPHSRTSRIRLRGCTVDFIAERIGKPLPTHETMIDEPIRGYAVVRPLPCPAELVSAFISPRTPPVELVRTFIPRQPPAESVVGTTWFADDACWGSVNHSSFWTQRKPLIGYWKTPQEPAVAFRLRFLHDGEDFASMGLRSAQVGPRTLAMLHAQPNRGDWHRSLDRPSDGDFIASDFRVRCELTGAGVQAEQLEAGVFELSAGGYRVVVHTLPSHFHGHSVAWRLGYEEGRVFLDGVCYSGDARNFRFDAESDIALAVGLELITADELICGQSPTWVERTKAKKETQWFLPEGEALRVR